MRQPAVAGRFYPRDGDSLREVIEGCFLDPLGSGLPVSTGTRRAIRGAMVPHAGYMASGANASNVYRMIQEDGIPDAFVVIGPDHHGTCAENTFSSDPYSTPLGTVGIHEGICDRLSGMLPDIPEAQVYEHSIEVQVPFIQFIAPGAKVVPVLMSDQSPMAAERLADALRKACEGYDVVFIASTDMSHYIPKQLAETLDSKVLDRISDMDWKGMYRTVYDERISMCGYGPVATVMMLCDGCGCEVIAHTDSYDSLGIDPNSVVGYGTAIFVQ